MKEVVFALGYCWEKLKEFFGDGSALGLHLQYSVEEAPLGTGGAIKKATELVAGEAVFAMNGDIISDLDPRDGLLALPSGDYSSHPASSPSGFPLWRFANKPERPGGGLSREARPPRYLHKTGGASMFSPRGRLNNYRRTEILRLLSSLPRAGQLAAFRYRGFWRTVDSLKELEGLEKELADETSQYHPHGQIQAREKEECIEQDRTNHWH